MYVILAQGPCTGPCSPLYDAIPVQQMSQRRKAHRAPCFDSCMSFLSRVHAYLLRIIPFLTCLKGGRLIGGHATNAPSRVLSC
eukprot:1160940-Pelagomonas_calceolata.AAC.3